MTLKRQLMAIPAPSTKQLRMLMEKAETTKVKAEKKLRPKVAKKLQPKAAKKLQLKVAKKLQLKVAKRSQLSNCVQIV